MPASQPPAPAREKPRQHKILFQQYFKSAGPRTYAAQLKQAGNGNHFLVLTEGKRDPKTDELRKTSVYIFSEDFPQFFRLLHEAAQFVKANPVSDQVRQRQRKFWQKKSGSSPTGGKAPTRPGANAAKCG